MRFPRGPQSLCPCAWMLEKEMSSACELVPGFWQPGENPVVRAWRVTQPPRFPAANFAELVVGIIQPFLALVLFGPVSDVEMSAR